MIQFSINNFSNGLTGTPYKSIKDAIIDECKIISENEFYKGLYSLPLNEQKTHIQFIREQLNLYYV